MSRVVTASDADSVRITRADGTAVQIPAGCILAVDRICRGAIARECRIEVEALADDATGDVSWQASLDGRLYGAIAGSPWAALFALAEPFGDDDNARR